MQTKKGFTLIELLVVVLIIGILAAVALPQYQKAVEKARITEALSILRTVANANQVFYLANGRYADWSELELLDIQIPGTSFDGVRRQTNHFIYAPGVANNHDHAIASAQRIPFNQAYRIFISSNDPERLHCTLYDGVSDVQKKLCQQIETNGML